MQDRRAHLEIGGRGDRVQIVDLEPRAVELAAALQLQLYARADRIVEHRLQRLEARHERAVDAHQHVPGL